MLAGAGGLRASSVQPVPRTWGGSRAHSAARLLRSGEWCDHQCRQERQLEEGEVQRSQRPEARPLLSSHREYRFRARDPAEVVKEAMGQRSLRTWISGPAATAASELEARAALQERLLTRRRRQLSMELAWPIKHVVRRYRTCGRTPSCSFQERPLKRTMSCSATGLSARGSSPCWMLYEPGR
jgi:hypothetical protein